MGKFSSVEIAYFTPCASINTKWVKDYVNNKATYMTKKTEKNPL